MGNFETAKQLFIEGLQLLEANDFQSAETRFTRSLELIPDRVSTLNNLSVIKIRLKKFAEAEALALRAVALDSKSPEAWSNLGIALTSTQRHEEALPAYDRALHSNPAYARAWLNKALTLLELKRLDEALRACDQALKLNSGEYEFLYTKSLILKELQRPDEAKKIYLEALELKAISAPAFITERKTTQKAEVLIVSHKLYVDASLKSYEALHLECPNFPGQIVQLFQDDFHFNLAFESVAAIPSARKHIPQPDLVINNATNGESLLLEGSLTGLTTLVDSFGVPVINHPAKAVQTTRDTSTKLLQGLPGVVVPKTKRFSSAGKTHEELAHEIEEQYDYPLITRMLTFQRGIGMTKVDSRNALIEVLTADQLKDFFVTQFVDGRGENKFYRKIRAAVVKGEIIIVRVDYDTYWNIHGRKNVKRVPFYLENRHLLEIEKKICANPETELGQSAMQSLRMLCERIPLDAFGVDFEVGPDGSVIFYEANATMNLFSTAQKEVPNPKEPNDRLKLAFHRYLTAMAAT